MQVTGGREGGESLPSPPGDFRIGMDQPAWPSTFWTAALGEPPHTDMPQPELG